MTAMMVLRMRVARQAQAQHEAAVESLSHRFLTVHSWCTTFITWYAAAASRPEVGSSRNSSVGDTTSSHPMPTRLRWPPLMPRMKKLPMYV